jgi:uncharacterized delta-60 repeat protein
MRSQTQWLRRILGVFTLTTTLFSLPATDSFAQASLFDPTFKVGSGANGTVYSIVVQEDGKIVVGGEFTQIAGQSRTNLARLNSDGQLDTTFPQGTDGAVYRLLKQLDGRILVGGAFTNLQGIARQGIGRLFTNGIVDASLDAGTNIPFGLAVLALATQADGKILASLFYPPSLGFAFLNRFTPDGQLDSNFVQTNVFQDGSVFALCPRPNGSILAGGDFQKVNNFSTPGLALITTNGVLDTNFSPLLKTNSTSFDYSVAYTITVLPDFSLLIGGKFWRQGSSNRSAVAKLTPALAWDVSFQPDIFDPVYDWQLGYVMSTIQQSDGKFVLGGLFHEVDGYSRRNIVRLDAQGKVDPCFDPGLGLGGNSGLIATIALAQEMDGKILAGGNFISASGSPVVSLSSSNLTRFLPQSVCNATRLYLGKYGPGQDFVAATCAPGGTNFLQLSTNLVDWITVNQFPFIPSTSPYLYFDQLNIPILEGGLFFRVKKEY